MKALWLATYHSGRKGEEMNQKEKVRDPENNSLPPLNLKALMLARTPTEEGRSVALRPDKLHHPEEFQHLCPDWKDRAREWLTKNHRNSNKSLFP